METAEIVNSLYKRGFADRSELRFLIENRNGETAARLFRLASETARRNFGNKIFIRGLIEMTNFCKNDCFYCGIRRSNVSAQRYRLTKYEIMECCRDGYSLGFRTFVLQGGEDGYYTDDIMTDIISSIRTTYPDCAITLSLGEKTKDTYKKYYDAGADRYLLRHESANQEHYAKLHPREQTLASRMECLQALKDIGFQVGCGFMVGSPFQTTDNIVDDLLFIKDFSPHMVGIGPFIPHHDTPFRDMPPGTAELTLFLLAIVRLMNPKVLLPATTALGTIDGNGRELGILAGCNVIMPNLSPVGVRKKYMLYDNKISWGDEAAEARSSLEKRVAKIGYRIVTDRGDHPDSVSSPLLRAGKDV